MPYLRYKTSPDQAPTYFRRDWNVQKGRSTPLEFQFELVKVTPGYSYTNPGQYGRWRALSSSLQNTLMANVRSDLSSQVSEAPNLIVNLAEGQQLLDLFVQSATGLAKSLLALKHGEFGYFRRLVRESPKTWHDTWLKFHFGVEPVVKDAYALSDFLSAPLKSHYVDSTKSGTESFSSGEANSARWRHYTSYSIRGRGPVSINNPNLYLASKLGLVNPAVVAWELVPFSFVVDWFTTFGSVLASYTDFLGVNTSLLSYTERYKGQRKEWIQYSNGAYYDGPTYHQFYLHRVPGLPPAFPAVRPFKGLSVTRGVTATALLLQQLNRF